MFPPEEYIENIEKEKRKKKGKKIKFG